ncbi:MAG: serine hydrolase [Bacteroidetes bacterium]|nr:serine hydrolase [Bacteroidota bacterium]MBU1114977.1 serine hydrolase [Bacteroidota bacterium]MBU1798699.1 serine hydrolase [Bacteroidota bacterium]
MKAKFFILLFFISISINCQSFTKVDDAINTAIENSIFPGATILVGNENSILYEKAYGHFTYDSNSPKVENNSIFDLASVTKAFGTNFCVMKLVDEGKLDINMPVSFYLPEFAASGKENVKVIDLLIHESGLQPYYTPNKDEAKAHILDTIKALNLNYETGSKMVYSCLNFVSTMMLVESIANEPMYKFYAENFTIPLKMERTMFTPNDEYKKLCVPATPDLQGVVHDPLARALKGLSGNAGLFSTTEDLSKLCQLLLNKGVFNDKRYLSEEVVSKFTKRYSDKSTRAIGFDTRSDDSTASSGKYFSNGTFGHLGYTGTSIWIDPVRKIYAIFLTNRVYPDDEASIRNTRPKVYDAVILSLEGK